MLDVPLDTVSRDRLRPIIAKRSQQGPQLELNLLLLVAILDAVIREKVFGQLSKGYLLGLGPGEAAQGDFPEPLFQQLLGVGLFR